MSSTVQHAQRPFKHQHRTSSDSAHHKIDYVAIIGRIAAILSVVMYVSYITQIANNLDGNPGSPWQPLAAFFNCSFWTLYGFLKPKKDIPIIIANVPGIFLALATVITSFVH